MLFGPDRNIILMADRPSYPSIEELREDKLKLAGRQINPKTFMPHGNRGYRNPRLRLLDSETFRHFSGLPENARFRFFNWSPSGKRIGFCLVTPTGLQLWSCPVDTLRCQPIGEADINNSLGGVPFEFAGDDLMLVKRRIAGAQRPSHHQAALGPVVQDTSGVEGSNRTYTNLLENQQDVDLFRYYAQCQLWKIDLMKGSQQPWGRPGIISTLSSSPNREYYLAAYVTEPFSFNVPYEKFADRIEVLDA
ncbi:MAG: hypothetical protein AAF597_13335, partial [Bacteroidota bacterium]